MFNYESAKEFFFRKLETDRVGKNRMESALYHTAAFIYEAGCKDADEKLKARITELEKQLQGALRDGAWPGGLAR